MLPPQLRLHKIFQGMDPQIDLLMAMFLTKLNNILILIPGNEKVEQILSHTQFPTQMDDSFIKIIHLEQR